MTSPKMTPIVDRRYSVADEPGRELVVMIGQPEPDPEPGGNWRCALQVVGIDPEPRYIHGIDGLQALLLAIGVARKTLSALSLTWEGGEDIGIDYSVPGFLPTHLQRDLERCIEDMVGVFQRALLELAERFTGPPGAKRPARGKSRKR